MTSKQTKNSALAKPAFLFACLSLFAQGCQLGELVDKIFGHADDLTETVTSSLDNAIGNLNANSANYQEILQKLIAELPSEVQSTITNEVSNLLNRTIAAAGAEVRCDVDFFRIRVQQALQRIRAKFMKQNLPPYEPQFCDVVPLAIDMNLPAERRPKLEFYGYDFDMAKIQVVLVDGANQIDVSNKLDQPTHYHMTLNLGSNGVPLTTNSSRIILRWNNRDISSVSVIQKAPVICQTSFFQFQPDRISYMPPYTRGDKEFDGNGPNIYSNVNLINLGNQLIARIYMKAVETSSDWTTAEGTKDFVIYTADPGRRIEAVVTAGSASYSYTDNNHDMDEFPGAGPVRKYSFMGDGSGDDVGYHTRVEIDFTNIRVQLKETGDCISSTTLRLLELQNAISPALMNKVKAMKSIEFKTPNE
jgi:hypothetical protein